MTRPTRHNFHLPLPEGLYRRLQRESQRTGAPATRVVREALELHLRDREREAVHEGLTEYVARMAGTGVDLDEDLAEAALEALRETSEPEP